MLQYLRKGPGTPVIILSAHDKTANKIESLELGADDYMTKPFAPEEVLARVKAVLRRRMEGATPPELPYFDDGYLKIDIPDRRVFITGQRDYIDKT